MARQMTNVKDVYRNEDGGVPTVALAKDTAKAEISLLMTAERSYLQLLMVLLSLGELSDKFLEEFEATHQRLIGAALEYQAHRNLTPANG